MYARRTRRRSAAAASCRPDARRPSRARPSAATRCRASRGRTPSRVPGGAPRRCAAGPAPGVDGRVRGAVGSRSKVIDSAGLPADDVHAPRLGRVAAARDAYGMRAERQIAQRQWCHAAAYAVDGHFGARRRRVDRQPAGRRGRGREAPGVEDAPAGAVAAAEPAAPAPRRPRAFGACRGIAAGTVAASRMSGEPRRARTAPRQRSPLPAAPDAPDASGAPDAPRCRGGRRVRSPPAAGRAAPAHRCSPLFERRRVAQRAALSEQIAAGAADGESEREHEADDAHGAADVRRFRRIRQHRRRTRDGRRGRRDPLFRLREPRGRCVRLADACVARVRRDAMLPMRRARRRATRAQV